MARFVSRFRQYKSSNSKKGPVFRPAQSFHDVIFNSWAHQSPVIDDGNQVAEIDHTISRDIKDTGFWAVSLITREAHTHPSAASCFATIGGGLDTDILHTAGTQFGAAINLSTSRATGPNSVIELVALKICDVVNAVVRAIVWILEAAGTPRIHALISNVNAGQTRVPSSTKDLKALELFHVIRTSQCSQLRVFVAASTSRRSWRAVNPSSQSRSWRAVKIISSSLL